MSQQPEIALCQLSFPDTTMAEDIEIAKTVGAGGISVSQTKVDTENAKEQVDAMRRAGRATALGVPRTWTILPPLGGTFPGQPEDPEERIGLIAEAVGVLAAFEPVSIFICTGPAGDRSQEEAMGIVADGIGEIARVAASHDTRVSVEPMREMMRPVRTIVASLSETLELLDRVGRDDVGIVFDTWHLWDSPRVHEILPEVVGMIDAVQIADYRQPTRTSMDRVVAGDGVIDFPRILGQLRQGGFEGWYDLEIFSDDGRFGTELEDSLWKLPPVEFAQRQVTGFLECWAATE